MEAAQQAEDYRLQQQRDYELQCDEDNEEILQQQRQVIQHNRSAAIAKKRARQINEQLEPCQREAIRANREAARQRKALRTNEEQVDKGDDRGATDPVGTVQSSAAEPTRPNTSSLFSSSPGRPPGSAIFKEENNHPVVSVQREATPRDEVQPCLDAREMRQLLSPDTDGKQCPNLSV